MEDSSDEDGIWMHFVSYKHRIVRFLFVDNRDEQLKLLASPVKEKENKTPPKKESGKATERNVRRKAKKTITRTFKDEEGYLGEIWI